MGKNTNFSGQPILTQLLMFLDKGQIRKISKANGGGRYVKKIITYNLRCCDAGYCTGKLFVDQ